MIRIVVDSGSDITPECAKELNIDVLPLTVRFGDKEYKSGVEITNEEFYEKLKESKTLPATSQVNPYDFKEKYKELLSNPEDEILSIHMSSGMSGTYQSAVLAKSNMDTDKITVVDSLNVSGGYTLLVYEAIRMRDAGKSVAEIVDRLNDLIPRVRLYFVLDTLEYLRKGGRISSSVAFVGGILGLHPVVSVKDGNVCVLDKVKGRKSANKWLLNQLNVIKKDPTVPVVINHSAAVEKAETLKGLLAEEGVEDIFTISCMGPIVGTHGGADAIGLVYVEE